MIRARSVAGGIASGTAAISCGLKICRRLSSVQLAQDSM
jgi:hypothetical protein